MKASTSSSEKVLRIPSKLIKHKRSISKICYRMILIDTGNGDYPCPIRPKVAN